ncbi:MAG: hypothetical protein IKT93_02280 [Clostridia bacterium]|nr:hypothetical protein [Clostridia bacterium]
MKLFIITKRKLMMFACLTVAVVITIVGSANVFANSQKLLPIYCVETNKKQIAISFDAAWGNSKKVQNTN